MIVLFCLARADKGKSALDLARERGHGEVVGCIQQQLHSRSENNTAVPNILNYIIILKFNWAIFSSIGVALLGVYCKIYSQ